MLNNDNFALFQASVSVKRMNKFMNVDELDPNSVAHDNQESKIKIIVYSC